MGNTPSDGMDRGPIGSEDCQHGPDEDCMICQSCGRCDETLDEKTETCDTCRAAMAVSPEIQTQLETAQQLQSDFWAALLELETSLGGIEIDSNCDLEGVTVADLLAGRCADGN